MPQPSENPQSRCTTVCIVEDECTLRHIPVGDLILQTELRVATEKHVRSFRCPCQDCKGGHWKSIQVIRQHHEAMDRDPGLTKSLLGGDPLHGYPRGGMWVEDFTYDDDIIENMDTSDRADVNIDVEDDIGENVPEDQGPLQLDEFHEVQRQVMEALD